MQHQDLRILFEKLMIARDECSREWSLSDTVVMCLEIDMVAAMPLPRVPGHSEKRHGPPHQLVRITFFDERSVRLGEAVLTPEEKVSALQKRAMVEDWIAGRVDRLPASNSTRVADRLRGA